MLNVTQQRCRELYAQITEWHEKYSLTLEAWHQTHGYWTTVYPRPAAEVSLCAPKHCGLYISRRKTCVYSLPYAVLNESYEETVAHECVHHYQRVVLPGCQWHGDMFKYLLRVVCGFRDAKTTHDYSVRQARSLSRVLTATLPSQGKLYAPEQTVERHAIAANAEGRCMLGDGKEKY